jgi:hypothetical protein
MMPTRPFLAGQAFEPELIRQMTRARTNVREIRDELMIQLRVL